ncbi:MAG: hypothetical protein U0263_34140 [Polyangiaceae bacterium]
MIALRSGVLCCVLLSALLACKSSPGSGSCRARLVFEGKPFEATGDDPEKAKQSVCLGWCTAHDPTIDAALVRWKATPEGAKSTDTRFGDVYSNLPGGRELLERCKTRCLGQVNAEQPSPVTVSCP